MLENYFPTRHLSKQYRLMFMQRIEAFYSFADFLKLVETNTNKIDRFATGGVDHKILGRWR